MITNFLNLAPNAIEVDAPDNLPAGVMVYVLFADGSTVVCGIGKRARAKVIFDSLERATITHLKSFKIRALLKHGGVESWRRFIVPCPNRQAALELEAALHDIIGGNDPNSPLAVTQWLLDGLEPETARTLQLAMASAFSPLRDLKVWRNKGLISDADWFSIINKVGAL